MVNPHSDKKNKTGTTYGFAGMGNPADQSYFGSGVNVKPKTIVDTKAQQEQNESTGNQGITNVFPTSTPEMTTGFGSFTGASSGSTGSSPLVQETLRKIFQKAIDDRKKQAEEDKEFYTADMHNQAIFDAFENVYPNLPSMDRDEFIAMGGDKDIYDMFDSNLMDIPPGQTAIEDEFLLTPNYNPGIPGDFDIGGGGTYGAGIASGLLNQRPKQLGDDENIPPQLRLLQYMVNVHRGNPYTKLAMRKKDGGLATIVGD